MSFNSGGGNGSISAAADTSLSNLLNDDVLAYDSSVSKWRNKPIGGPTDATTTTKGVVQLAGDLGGTAAAPTVPGLANKANITDSRFVAAPSSSRSASFTLSLPDAGSIIEATSSSSMSVTVPASTSVGFIDNTMIEISQVGSGQVTLVPDTGVVLQNAGGLKTRGQWSSIALRKRPGGSTGAPPTANLLLRYRADDITGTNGSSIAAWPESSGNGLPDAVQATTANRPTLVLNALNGHKGVNFDGNNDFLSLTGAALDVARNRSALTVHIVYTYTATQTATRTLLGISTGTSAGSARVFMGIRDSNGFMYAGGRRLDTDGATFVPSATTITTGDASVFTARFNYGTRAVAEYKNGTSIASIANFQTAGSTSDTSSLGGTIGANTAGVGEFFNGRIMEILVYGIDDSTQRTRVHNYVQNTYGISVSDFSGIGDEWVVTGDTTL